jgi:MoxR-like ATPase
MDLLDKFAAARKELSSKLIERDKEIDITLVALAAEENVLLVGPPGCAKTSLLTGVAQFVNGSTFTHLMTKFTTPEEVFGPFNLKLLKEGEYVRNTEGMMAEANFVFLDEVWKASSAILNTLLQMLNEKKFKNGKTVYDIPMRLCVAASNEWPSEDNGQKELSALFDRFVLRTEVKPIRSKAGKERLLFSEDKDLIPFFDEKGKITDSELTRVRGEVNNRPIGIEFKESLFNCLSKMKEEGIAPGDRRLRKAVRVAKANSFLNGHTEVEPEDGEILTNVLWDDKDQMQKAKTIITESFNPTGAQLTKYAAEAEEIVSKTNMRQDGEVLQSMKKLRDLAESIRKVKRTAQRDAVLASVEEEAKIMKMKFAEI